MRSVADDLRAQSRERVARLSPIARLRLAFELGDADVALFARARGISLERARQIFASRRSAGRIPSVANHDTM